MKKFYYIIILVVLIIGTSCSKPKTIKTYSPDTKVSNTLHYDSMTMQEGNIILNFKINVENDIVINDYTSFSSIEIHDTDKGYGFGDGFANDLNYLNDYKILINGNIIDDLSNYTLTKGEEYILSYSFDVFEFNDNIDFSKINEVSVIIEFDHVDSQFINK